MRHSIARRRSDVVHGDAMENALQSALYVNDLISH